MNTESVAELVKELRLCEGAFCECGNCVKAAALIESLAAQVESAEKVVNAVAVMADDPDATATTPEELAIVKALTAHRSKYPARKTEDQQ